MRRLLPRSLLWRTFLLLGALVIASTAAWFLIFRAYENEPRARALAQNLVSVVNLTHVALLTAQPEKRRALLAELAEREGIQVYASEPGEQIVPLPRSELLALTINLVRAQLGDETRFAVRRNDLPGLWVSFHIDEDEYWVRIPRERLERRIALRWFMWGVVALALALVAAYLIVSHLSRPLRTLAGAAREIGRGRTPAPAPEDGPEELRTLARAFNQMTRDLQRLENERAEILAGVSHDLRTPLARLRLGIEMSAPDESLREGMNADIEEMDRIVGQFLDYAKLNGGEAAEAVDPGALLAEVAGRFRKQSSPVTLTLPEGITPPLQGRPLMLRRAVANLVDNALRHAGSAVEVTLRRETNQAVIEVLDHGPGIPEAERERLKQPFTRMERARGDVGGSGLGLAIVDRVAQAHGGRFELAAREGGGLAARLILPLDTPA